MRSYSHCKRFIASEAARTLGVKDCFSKYKINLEKKGKSYLCIIGCNIRFSKWG